MGLTIWYITKYASTPSVKGRVGTRGFKIMQELSRLGNQCLMFVSDAQHLTEIPIQETPYRRVVEENVEIHWVRTLRYSGARSFRRILSWLHFEWRLWRMPHDHLERPDIVIASSLSLLSVINGIIISSRYRCKFVLEIRDIWPLVLHEEGGFGYWNPGMLFLSAIEWIGYKKANIIVGTMPNLGRHVERRLGYAKPTYCIPMGVDTDLYENLRPLEDAYAQRYFPDEKFIICHAGTMGVSNALETFLDCARLMKDNPIVQFVLLGDGYMKAEYEQMTMDLKNVTFAPPVAKEMVHSALQRCELVYFAMHPSKMLEFGQSLNKLIDYMMSGRPVLASFDGYQSMINEANCGSFVPANDPVALKNEIERYLELSREDRLEIGDRGRRWILEHRQYEKLASDYLKILN